jgi:STE24 endopeptidase
MLAITLVLGAPLLAAILWVMGAAGADWAWWAWGVWVAFNLLVLWLYPSFIAPLFNRFTPLDDPALSQRIHALARRCHFGLSGLFVMDGSRRSAHGNAYFTGFGRHRRIVFFDTLLSRLDADEVEAVLAHELGHFAHHHILRRLVLGFVAAGLFLHLLAWLSTQVWFYTGLGVIPQLSRPNGWCSSC